MQVEQQSRLTGLGERDSETGDSERGGQDPRSSLSPSRLHFESKKVGGYLSIFSTVPLSLSSSLVACSTCFRSHSLSSPGVVHLLLSCQVISATQELTSLRSPPSALARTVLLPLLANVPRSPALLLPLLPLSPRPRPLSSPGSPPPLPPPPPPPPALSPPRYLASTPCPSPPTIVPASLPLPNPVVEVATVDDAAVVAPEPPSSRSRDRSTLTRGSPPNTPLGRSTPSGSPTPRPHFQTTSSTTACRPADCPLAPMPSKRSRVSFRACRSTGASNA